MPSFKKYVQRHDSKRGHFMDYWRSLRTTDPIYMTPITKTHVGSTKAEDGIRISGSNIFIATVIARLKDLLALDNLQTKLEISFKQSQYPRENGDRSYILYLHAKQR